MMLPEKLGRVERERDPGQKGRKTMRSGKVLKDRTEIGYGGTQEG